MANSREISDRIKSIKQTRQITNAMYMISSSKLTKAKQRLVDTEPYFNTLKKTIGTILLHSPDIENEYFSNEDADHDARKKIGFLVITADKGLAGAYNLSVLKTVERIMAADDASCYFMVVGEVGRHYFAHHGIPMAENFEYTAQNPSLGRSRMITDRIIELYKNEDLDAVYVIYTRMVNALKCETAAELVLPLKKTEFISSVREKYPIETEFYPSENSVINVIVPNYITGFVYGALTESFCSEQNSRMTAMQSATDSANDMLRELSIAFNHNRQAAITQEITEVIGGARVLRQKKDG